MPKYNTMKNADLESLLKERGLPHTGKKAEMVSRLEDDDKKKNNEDEIDWDDEGGDAIAEAEKPTEAAPITTAPAPADVENQVDGNNPQAVPNQAAAIDPSTTNDLTIQEPTELVAVVDGAETEKEPAKVEVDYTVGLPSTDIDKELEARKRRAERFNIKPEEMDTAAADAQKRLERQKKFGEAAPETVKIDSALSEHRKRGREGGDDRGDFKRGRGRGGRIRGGGGRGGGRDRGPRREREPREERSEGGRGDSWMNADDRVAAERRKARWGA